MDFRESTALSAMPKDRPAISGYARIAQAEEEEYLDDSEDDHLHDSQRTISSRSPQYAPIQPGRHGRMQGSGIASPGRRTSKGRRHRSNSGVDIKAINARLERWADEIASKFKIRKVKGKTTEEEQLEIHHSVFQAPEWVRPASAETLASGSTNWPGDRLTKFEYDDIVESVRVAIEMGVHPKLISQGSSGSYFARNPQGKVVGVFKPKDEEPYASRNPKWTKWIHRNLFPFFFGRACLIPNLSYVSEAAAYVLDTRLRTNIVPYTDIVYLSSKSFFYDFWDRRAYYRKRKPLPQKVGSLQVFLKGYKDANLLLKEHPWPDSPNSSFRTGAAPRTKRRPWAGDCRPGGTPSDDEDEGVRPISAREAQNRRGFWTEALQESFRKELEKLVVLDYIMRNTDRGLDNWMIKIDVDKQEASVVAEPPRRRANHNDNHAESPPLIDTEANGLTTSEQEAYRRQEPMTAGKQDDGKTDNFSPVARIGAIDNSLSWPWKHPDAWRSFPFGWLFLPVSLIGQPFSESTRLHFLPLLTSKTWWSETQLALRRVFSQDADFKENMFARQIAVMKGQAWNVVETLKTPDHGPLELARRVRVCVWDDIVEIPTVVPLRVPSTEMRRREEDRRRVEIEEMDISSAHASAPEQAHDLLSMGSISPEEPAPHRFDISRHANGFTHVDEAVAGPLSPETAKAISWHARSEGDNAAEHLKDLVRPPTKRLKTRLSLDGAGRLREVNPTRPRRLSLNVRRSSGGAFDGVDDLEGDLGYAAAEDMEGNRKKVIVERLEMVKSRNPVFTWC